MDNFLLPEETHFILDHIQKEDYVNLLTDEARKLPVYLSGMARWTEGESYYTSRKNSPRFFMLYTVKGQGMLEYRRCQRVLSPGSLFIIDAMEPHLYNTYDCKEWEFIWFHVYGNVAKSVCEYINGSSLRIVSIPDKTMIPEIFAGLRPYMEISSEYNNICISEIMFDLMSKILTFDIGVDNAAGGEDIFYPIAEKLHGEILLGRNMSLTGFGVLYNMPYIKLENIYVENYGLSPVESILDRNRASAPAWIHRAMAALSENYTDFDCVKKVREDINVSGSHFSAAFKASTGMTPMEYVMLLRVKKAESLLRDKTGTLGEIAFSCGFSSQVILNEQVRKYTGKSPREIYYKNG